MPAKPGQTQVTRLENSPACTPWSTAITTLAHICHYTRRRVYSDLHCILIRSKLRQRTGQPKFRMFPSLTSFLPAPVNFLPWRQSKHTCAHTHTWAPHVHMQTRTVHTCSMWSDDAHSFTTLLLTWPTCLTFTTPEARFPTVQYLTLHILITRSSKPTGQWMKQYHYINIMVSFKENCAFLEKSSSTQSHSEEEANVKVK